MITVNMLTTQQPDKFVHSNKHSNMTSSCSIIKWLRSNTTSSCTATRPVRAASSSDYAATRPVRAQQHDQFVQHQVTTQQHDQFMQHHQVTTQQHNQFVRHHWLHSNTTSSCSIYLRVWTIHSPSHLMCRADNSSTPEAPSETYGLRGQIFHLAAAGRTTWMAPKLTLRHQQQKYNGLLVCLWSSKNYDNKNPTKPKTRGAQTKTAPKVKQ